MVKTLLFRRVFVLLMLAVLGIERTICSEGGTMLKGHSIARPIAECLRDMRAERGEEFALDDGTAIRIVHGGFAELSWEAEANLKEDGESEWLIAARDEGDVNPQELPFVFVSRGEQQWSTKDNDGITPDWTLPIINRFISVEPLAVQQVHDILANQKA